MPCSLFRLAFPSLSSTHLSFLRVFSGLTAHFFFFNIESYSFVWMYQFIYPLFHWRASWLISSVGYYELVQFSHSVVSDSLWPHGLQHTRPPCPPPTPKVYSNSCPLSWWWHPIISSSVIPFSSRLQSFPASGSFPKSQFFASGGWSIGVSASASVLPMNIQDWFL